MHAFIFHNQSLRSALKAQISALVWSGNLNARLSSAALSLIADAASGSDGIFLKKKCRHTTATHSFFVSASFVSGRKRNYIVHVARRLQQQQLARRRAVICTGRYYLVH